MNPDLRTVLDAAMKLPPEQQRELIVKLSDVNSRQKKPGVLRKYFGMINSGDPHSADNDKIDADLARAYIDDHESEN
jgi:hypothetical protein